MRYVESRLKKENQDLAYRIYVTDSIRVAWHLNKRWWDVVNPSNNKKIDETRTPEEIISRISGGLDKLGKGDNTDESIHTVSDLADG